MLARARAQSRRLARLAADLLDLSRLDAEVELRSEPVELGELSRAVIAEFDVWRRVRAADGAVGWMAASMLSDQRTVLVTGKGRVQLFEKPEGGKVVALADPGAVARLVACTQTACHVRGEEVDGWIAKSRIWGVEANEVFEKIR